MNTAILNALIANPSVFFLKFVVEAGVIAAFVYGLVWLGMRPKHGMKLSNPTSAHSIGLVVTVIGSAMFRVIAMLTFAGRSAFDVEAGTLAGQWYLVIVPGIVAAAYFTLLLGQLVNSPSPAVRTNLGNDAYADALVEIEEGRLDKGTWARSFAESGGDESKARALYIKTRAEFAERSANVNPVGVEAAVQPSPPPWVFPLPSALEARFQSKRFRRRFGSFLTLLGLVPFFVWSPTQLTESFALWAFGFIFAGLGIAISGLTIVSK